LIVVEQSAAGSKRVACRGATEPAPPGRRARNPVCRPPPNETVSARVIGTIVD
jgi:hypothetical protein